MAELSFLSRDAQAELEAFVTKLIAVELKRRAPRPASTAASPYLRTDEAAEYMRCSRQRVYDLLSAHRLTRVKEGNRTLVSRAEIDSYLAADGASTKLLPTANRGQRH
jgi:excisionase family DNA binding protein